jgi:hypothetical protein
MIYFQGGRVGSGLMDGKGFEKMKSCLENDDGYDGFGDLQDFF